MLPSPWIDPNKPFVSALKIVFVCAILMGAIIGTLEKLLGVETDRSYFGPSLGLLFVIFYQKRPTDFK